MKNIISFLTMLLLLVGCATPLHVKVDTEITKGDSRERVREILGNPDDFGPSAAVAGGTDWTYRNSGSVCTLSFFGEQVSQISCDSSNYVSTSRKFLRGFSAAMKGAGQGLKRASEQPVQPIQVQQPIRCTRDWGLTDSYTCN